VAAGLPKDVNTGNDLQSLNIFILLPGFGSGSQHELMQMRNIIFLDPDQVTYPKLCD
jgi:hypothetical protein